MIMNPVFLFEFARLFFATKWTSSWKPSSTQPFFFFEQCIRWCACSVCEQWRKWNGVIYKVVLPNHKDLCSCTCPFCDSNCSSLEHVSSRYMMEHLLCPASHQFALSSVYLYLYWDCIYNRFHDCFFHYIGTSSLILRHIFVSSCHKVQSWKLLQQASGVSVHMP